MELQSQSSRSLLLAQDSYTFDMTNFAPQSRPEFGDPVEKKHLEA